MKLSSRDLVHNPLPLLSKLKNFFVGWWLVLIEFRFGFLFCSRHRGWRCSYCYTPERRLNKS